MLVVFAGRAARAGRKVSPILFFDRTTQWILCRAGQHVRLDSRAHSEELIMSGVDRLTGRPCIVHEASYSHSISSGGQIGGPNDGRAVERGVCAYCGQDFKEVWDWPGTPENSMDRRRRLRRERIDMAHFEALAEYAQREAQRDSWR